jgi:hypothetical protein
MGRQDRPFSALSLRGGNVRVPEGLSRRFPMGILPPFCQDLSASSCSSCPFVVCLWAAAGPTAMPGIALPAVQLQRWLLRELANAHSLEADPGVPGRWGHHRGGRPRRMRWQRASSPDRHSDPHTDFGASTHLSTNRMHVSLTGVRAHCQEEVDAK